MPYTSYGETNQTYVAQRYYTGSNYNWTSVSEINNTLDYVWWHQIQDNDTQHRVKPNDLLENVTPLATQYTRKKVAGSTGLYVWDDTETSSRSMVWRESRDYRGSFQPTDSTPDTSDWITPLRLKIKEEAINLGTTVAEYRQSVNMFGSAARGIANAWRSFRGLRKGRKPLTMCDVAGAELIYSYGVAPLVSDLYDSVEALKLRLGHPVFRRYHARSSDFVHTDHNQKYPISSSYGPGGYTGWSKWKQSKDIVAYVWFDLEKASQFILGNPLELAWEVIPFSFVVDWMIPIGDYLIALDATKFVDEMRVCISQKDVKEHRLYMWGLTSTAHSLGRHAARGPGAKPITFYERSHKRDVYDSIPLPTLPKFELSGSVRRLMNAVSLLTAVRGCKGRAPRYHSRDFPT